MNNYKYPSVLEDFKNKGSLTESEKEEILKEFENILLDVQKTDKDVSVLMKDTNMLFMMLGIIIGSGITFFIFLALFYFQKI